MALCSVTADDFLLEISEFKKALTLFQTTWIINPVKPDTFFFFKLNRLLNL